MKKIILVLIILILTIVVYGEKFPRIEVEKINENFSKLVIVTRGWNVNVLAFSGKDGLLLVDTGINGTAKELKDVIRKMYNTDPVYIINTHEHIDHLGGNFIFGKEPVVIGHEKLRKMLKMDLYLLEEFGDETLPDIGIKNEMVLHFNGEDIHIIPMTGSHSNNDLIVHFVKSKIIMTGDLLYDHGFPSVDPATGDVLKYKSVIDELVSYCNEDMLFVNGHTKNCRYKDLVEYQEMLESTLLLAKESVKKGENLTDIAKNDSYRKWADWQTDGYVDAKYWFKTIVDALNFKGPKPVYITGFLYKALENDGLKGMFSKFLNIKNGKDVKKYDITFWDLYVFAKYFEKKDEMDKAEQTYKFALKEYPKEIFVYQFLSEFYEKKGNLKSAIRFLKDFLKIDPDNKVILNKLKKLRSRL